MANHTAFFFDQTSGRPARAIGGLDWSYQKVNIPSVILSQEDENRRWGTLLSLPIPDAIALARWILREYGEGK